MSFTKRLLVSLLSLVVTFLVAGITASSASATTPTIPAGQELRGMTEWAPKYPVVFDFSSGAAVVLPATAPASAVDWPEGGGLDSSTGKTWLISDGCTLWNIDSQGVTTLVWDLTSTTSFTGLNSCDSLFINNDSTAFINGRKSDGGFLLHIDLATGMTIGNPVHARLGNVDPLISGLSKNPVTHDYWVSTVPSSDQIPRGLYRINIATGELDGASYIAIPSGDAWDIAFDSSGTLWMALWGQTFSISSIDIAANNPISTLNSFGPMNLASGETISAGYDSIWFVTTSDSPTLPTTDPTQTPSLTSNLAQTGANVPSGLTASGVLILAGLALLSIYLLRARRTRK